MKPVWSRRAARDLIEIFRFIGQDDPKAAEAWVRKLRAFAEKSLRRPGVGRWLPELSARRDLRELIFKGYRIVYLVRSSKVTIVTVFEGHQRLPRGL